MSGEDGFLAAIRAAPADDVPRLVYADWLEEQDRIEWSGYLRAECELASLAPDNPKRDGLLAFLREVAKEIDPDWLATVTRLPVEKCGLEFQFRCPKRWEQLELTTVDSVRFCGECGKNVYFCTTIAEAQSIAGLNNCVAVDPRLVRKPNDLETVLEENHFFVGEPIPPFGFQVGLQAEFVPKAEEPERLTWWQRFARRMRGG